MLSVKLGINSSLKPVTFPQDSVQSEGRLELETCFVLHLWAIIKVVSKWYSLKPIRHQTVYGVQFQGTCLGTILFTPIRIVWPSVHQFFTEVISIQQHYVRISRIVFEPNWTVNVESTDWTLHTPLSRYDSSAAPIFTKPAITHLSFLDIFCTEFYPVGWEQNIENWSRCFFRPR